MGGTDVGALRLRRGPPALRRIPAAPGEKPPGTELPGLDFVALARGQGCAAVHVERADDLRDALVRALRSPTPVLLGVEVA